MKTKTWHYYSGKANPEDFKNCRIFAGTSNPALCEEIAGYLGLPLDGCKVGAFADGEVSVKIENGVRGKHVFIIQSVCRSPGSSVNDALVQLLLLISAMRRADCASITCVIPYYGYARQDRKLDGRVPISAADVAHMITNMGCNRVVSVDLHCGQIAGFFPPQVPVLNLYAGPIGAVYFSEKNLVNPVIVSPDAGGVYRAKEFKGIFEEKSNKECGFAMIVKQRSGASSISAMNLVGTVQDSDVILVDDMVDTAGTLVEAAKVLKANGARRVYAFCTHGLLNGPAAKRVSDSCIDELVVTNTTPIPEHFASVANVKVLSLAPIIAETINRLARRGTLSTLFKAKM